MLSLKSGFKAVVRFVTSWEFKLPHLPVIAAGLSLLVSPVAQAVSVGELMPVF